MGSLKLESALQASAPTGRQELQTGCPLAGPHPLREPLSLRNRSTPAERHQVAVEQVLTRLRKRI